jgi:hypothetical protein
MQTLFCQMKVLPAKVQAFIRRLYIPFHLNARWNSHFSGAKGMIKDTS